MEQMSALEAFGRLTAFCAAGEHCLAEVRERLRRWNVAPDEAETLVQRLVQEKYIDESRYCRAFINDKVRFARWGRIKIAQALRQKQIPTSLYLPLLDEIDEACYSEQLRRLLEAKQREVKGRNAYERKAKLVRFALGRGYEMDEICRFIPHFEENELEE